jgi:hypothetical protein
VATTEHGRQFRGCCLLVVLSHAHNKQHVAHTHCY